MDVQLNTCVPHTYFVSIKIPSTKRGVTPSNVTMTLKFQHRHDPVVLNNKIVKFDEEMLKNGKVKTNVKFSRQIYKAVPRYHPFFDRETHKCMI